MNPTIPRENRSWPSYMLGGRLRTSTAALLIAFFAIWWLYETYEPPAKPQQVPANEVVPPGFIPDPDYTWAPRTDVQRHNSTPTATTMPTPTPTSTTSPTPATTQTEAPSPSTQQSSAGVEPSRTTDSTGSSTPERPRSTVQTPAAAAIGPSTSAVSPPQ